MHKLLSKDMDVNAVNDITVLTDFDHGYYILHTKKLSRESRMSNTFMVETRLCCGHEECVVDEETGEEGVLVPIHCWGFVPKFGILGTQAGFGKRGSLPLSETATSGFPAAPPPHPALPYAHQLPTLHPAVGPYPERPSGSYSGVVMKAVIDIHHAFMTDMAKYP
eukprot:3026416-Amphidinium_carterae.1